MQADVVISWNHGPVPNAAKEAFKRPTKFITLNNPASWATALQEYWPFPVRKLIEIFFPGLEPLRVATLGFSASCQGVARLLSSSDGANLDAVIAIDGIHAGYSDKSKHIVKATSMAPWLNFAKLAVVNERLFVDSYSSVVPPYASTTETADYLWNTLTAGSAPFTNPPLPPIDVPPTTVKVAAGPSTGPARTVQYPSPPWKLQRRAGGLVLLGCNDLDWLLHGKSVPPGTPGASNAGTADHIYQAKAMLPAMVKQFLAARWNTIDPQAPGQSCFVAGARDPFDWIGSPMSIPQCAQSKVLSPGFVTSKSAAPLPTGTSVTVSGGASSKSSLLTSALLVAGGTLGLWWLASKQELGLLKNSGE